MEICILTSFICLFSEYPIIYFLRLIPLDMNVVLSGLTSIIMFYKIEKINFCISLIFPLLKLY